MDQNSIPAVLSQNRASDESQDTILNTVRLEPNSSSQTTTTFVLPRGGSVLDSNSSLVWSVAWDGENAQADQIVVLKNFSGALNSIRRARFFVGGKLLFTNPDVALTAHIHKLSTNPDHMEEVVDCKLGSQHGYSCGEVSGGGTPQASNRGQVVIANDVLSTVTSKTLSRQVGRYSLVAANNLSYEATLLLSEIFPALKHLQIPIKYLTEDCRIEIDWITGEGQTQSANTFNGAFDESMLLVSDQVNNITNFNISINNPLLYLDYLTYNEEVEAGLMMANQQGIAIPYREINIINKQLPAIGANTNSQDILLGFQGKLLMKVYVSHRYADQVLAGAGGNVSSDRGAAYARFNGRCRSDQGQDLKYNLSVNDLFIHDAKVDTPAMQYSFLSMTAQNPIYVYPNTFDYNSLFSLVPTIAGGVSNEITNASYNAGGVSSPAGAPANHSLTDAQCRDGIMGTQAFIGFDLSKYGADGGFVPGNAGYRVGSTPVILNIEQVGSGTPATRQALPKQVDVICESVKVLQIINGQADTMEA
tara:strand:- start:1671 stop:3269 length:1599 start_codon:yes stop_codon:yes gene_type:complete